MMEPEAKPPCTRCGVGPEPEAVPGDQAHEWLADLIETAMDGAMDVDVGTHELSKVAASAALSAMPSRVKVKPLVFEEAKHHTIWSSGMVFGGEVCLINTERGFIARRGMLLISDSAGETSWGTLAEAKSAARADYERRILATLTPTPDSMSVEEAAYGSALEALIALDKWVDESLSDMHTDISDEERARIADDVCCDWYGAGVGASFRDTIKALTGETP